MYTYANRGRSPEVFPWSGKNRYFWILHAKRGFGMGGGGSGFAFFLDEMLNTGMSQHSETFLNPCLSGADRFRCINMEVFALDTSVGATSSRPSSPYPR